MLERRDGTSADMLDIASKRIRSRLQGMAVFRDAQRIGAYYSTGSEIRTQDIIQDLLSGGREVYLPRVSGDAMEFREIADFASLESGSFGIMEPKDGCPRAGALDVILVPAVGVTPEGTRLGYGRGYYDRFLPGSGAVSVALTLEKQVIRSIPRSDHDHAVDWVVTEDRAFRTQ